MVIRLKQLYNIVGEKVCLDYVIDSERLNEVKGFTFSNPVAIKGTVTNRAGIVSLKYSAEFTLHICCDRCLIEFDRDYCFDFEHILVRSLSNDGDYSDEYIVTENDELDMDELALTDCLLSLPSKMLCREDCKGLCPKCGADLNHGGCNCGDQTG